MTQQENRVFLFPRTQSSSLLRLNNTPGSSSSSPSSSSDENDLSELKATSNQFQSELNINQNDEIDLLLETPPGTQNIKAGQNRQLDSSASNNNKNGPNIFKKIISRKALIPKLKAFKRISNDLQIESSPLHDEIQHELFITSAMRDKDEILNSGTSSLLLQHKDNLLLLNQDNLTKFEIINKANKSWNKHRRISTSSLTNSESSKTFKSISRRGSVSLAKISPAAPIRSKRKFCHDSDLTDGDDYDTESDDGWNHKRRLVSVSNSPILDSTTIYDPFSRRNSILIHNVQDPSEDFEMMQIK